MHFDRRLLGWGLFLIIAGAIPLLVRSGYLDRDLVADWPSLWPVLLIGWGLALVLRRTPVELLGSAVSVAVLGVMVGGLITTGIGGISAIGCGGGDNGTSFGNRSGTLESTADVGIEFNCGTLRVAAVDGSDWSIDGRGPDGRRPAIDADFDGVTIAPPEIDVVGFLQDSSEWNVDLPRDSRLDLGITLNAGEGMVDLPGASLGGVSLTLNAGSIDFGLAETIALSGVSATVNAGSATFDLPGHLDNASMTLNAGAIEVCLPAGTPVRVSWSGALGGNNFDAAGLDEIDDGHWQTPGYSSGDGIELSVSANAGSFSLDLGGSCDA